MSPPALQPYKVQLLLQYISNLDGEIPAHLLSKSLIQRHHFLGISPEDPSEYLCWPTNDPSERQRVSILLDSLSSPEVADPQQSYPVKYTSDGDVNYAHVHITTARGDNGLRLIFMWDAEGNEGAGSWKYHDAKLMPFPWESHGSPDGAATVSLRVLSRDSFVGEAEAEDLENAKKDDDDDYWNSYGGGDVDDDEAPPKRIKSSVSLDSEKAEEAYWAQYANVHGTADSARHSPRPLFGDQTLQTHQETVRILSHVVPHAFSPTDLSLRLNTISPKHSPIPYEDSFVEAVVPLDDTLSAPPLAESSNISSTASPTTKLEDVDADDISDRIPSPRPLKPLDVPFLSEPTQLEEQTFDDGFAQNVKGLYHMWSSERSTRAGSVRTKDAFLEDIRKIIDTL